MRNGFYPPPLTCKGCTKEYLLKVKSGEYYVPRFDAIKLRPCPCPPLKKRIYQEIMKLATQHNVNLGMRDESCGTVTWFLAVLGTI